MAWRRQAAALALLLGAAASAGDLAEAAGKTTGRDARLCVQPRDADSCLDRGRLLGWIWPKAPIGAAGAQLTDGRLADLIGLHEARTHGGRLFALAIIELVTPDPQGQRPDCHACAPSMVLVLLREDHGRWSISSRSALLQAPGSWGTVSADDLRIEHLGADRFLIGFASGYTGQGVTETGLTWYGNLAPDGGASKRLIELGTISTGTYVCGTGHLEESRDAQVITVYQGNGLPAFLRIEHSRYCSDDKPPLSRPPTVHRIDPATMRIRP